MDDSVLPPAYGRLSDYVEPKPSGLINSHMNSGVVDNTELSPAAKSELAYLALHVADWGQTRRIAKSPDTLHELNPLLGKHPTLGDVNRYFIATGLGHVAIAKLLEGSPALSALFQKATIGMELSVTGRNRYLGIGTSF